MGRRRTILVWSVELILVLILSGISSLFLTHSTENQNEKWNQVRIILNGIFPSGSSEVGGDVEELLGFFIKNVFVGVFQYDSGTPKHVLELKTSLKILDFAQKN